MILVPCLAPKRDLQELTSKSGLTLGQICGSDESWQMSP